MYHSDSTDSIAIHAQYGGKNGIALDGFSRLVQYVWGCMYVCFMLAVVQALYGVPFFVLSENKYIFYSKDG